MWSKNETALIPPAIRGNESWPVKTRHRNRVKPAFAVATGKASAHCPLGLLRRNETEATLSSTLETIIHMSLVGSAVKLVATRPSSLLSHFFYPILHTCMLMPSIN